MRTRENRIMAWTGTIHFATEAGHPACGVSNSHYSRWSVGDVTCRRCIAQFGADEQTGQTDPQPLPYDDDGAGHAARRAAERAARRAAREA